MTKKQKYEQLREAIIKAVPEIVELKFGCRVYVDWGDKKGITELTEEPNEQGFARWKCGVIDLRHDTTKILGREIRLADIILTMKKNDCYSKWTIMMHPEFDNYSLLELWELSHNSLSWHYENKPEVMEFLWEEICGK